MIQANVEVEGVVFSKEEPKNVLGFSLNCVEEAVELRPFTAGVTTSDGDLEVDAPFVTRWSADCDTSRSAKRYSDSVMVLNVRHFTKHNDTQPYLARLAIAVLDSIEIERSVNMCVDNAEFFLNNLTALVTTAKDNFTRRGDPFAAVEALDNATRLALPIPGTAPLPMDNGGDPYGVCPGNPKGLFVGRLMSLKFAACSELQQSDPGEYAQSPANCVIAADIFNEMPPLL